MTKEDIDKKFDAVCLRKRNLSENEANDYIDKYLIETNVLLYYYKCPFCSSIHLTKKEPYELEIFEVI